MKTCLPAGRVQFLVLLGYSQRGANWLKLPAPKFCPCCSLQRTARRGCAENVCASYFKHAYPKSSPRLESCFSIWWLKKYRPELLPREKHDDPYDHLRVDLAGLYR